jgi:hypothetical protein
MAQCTRTVATFLPVANFENQLHAHRIPEAETDGISEPPLRVATPISRLDSDSVILGAPKARLTAHSP